MPNLNPDLVISGPLSFERSIRFINTIKMIKFSVPILMISNDSGIKEFIFASWFSDIKFSSLTFNPYEIKVAIKNILRKKFNRLKYHKKYPLIIGNNTEI